MSCTNIHCPTCGHWLLEIENMGEARSRVNCSRCQSDVAVMFTMTSLQQSRKPVHTIMLSPKITDEAKELKKGS